MTEFLAQWEAAFPAFLIPLGVLAAATYVRKQFHRLWSPAADLYILLLSAEFSTMWEHNRFPTSPIWGVDVVQGTVLLAVFTLILLLFSLFAEKDITAFNAWAETEKELAKRSLPSIPPPSYPSTKLILLWLAGVALIAGQISLLLPQPSTPEKIPKVAEQRQ